jgi:hypothetical protein
MSLVLYFPLLHQISYVLFFSYLIFLPTRSNLSPSANTTSKPRPNLFALLHNPEYILPLNKIFHMIIASFNPSHTPIIFTYTCFSSKA